MSVVALRREKYEYTRAGRKGVYWTKDGRFSVYWNDAQGARSCYKIHDYTANRIYRVDTLSEAREAIAEILKKDEPK